MTLRPRNSVLCHILGKLQRGMISHILANEPATLLLQSSQRHLYAFSRVQDGSVGVARGYVLDDRGSISGSGKRFASTPQCPERL
jgi:hypothetical protein